MRFHIDKHGKPAVCKAEVGKCPLGDNPHFDTKAEAQSHFNQRSEEKYGLLPEVETISNEWKQKFLKHADFNEFVKENAREVMSDNLFPDENPRVASERVWKDIHYKSSSERLEDMKIEEAVKIVNEEVDKNSIHGWFREYDSDYKPRIEQTLITNRRARNASLKLAHENYKNNTQNQIDFEDFLDSEIEVYRGGNFDFINNDVFISYSFRREIAEKFALHSKQTKVSSIKVKMRETLGSLQTTGEAEVMIRRRDYDV